MKNYKKIGKLLIIMIIFLISGCNKKESIDNVIEPQKNNYVSYNGNLKVVGKSLLNQYGENIQLRGISSHGIQWFPDYINYDVLKELKNNWNTNVFRIAMYTAQDGYITDNSIKYKVKSIVDNAINLDMYVIIDWHTLHDNNPNTYIDEAIEFFSEMAQIYHDKPNVIYEICNEPNGEVSWDNDIKMYADRFIKEIRAIDEDAIIIVGTSTYSQDVDVASLNKLEYNNIMYALHFYAGTQKDELIKRVEIAINNDLPIFASEWGTSCSNGSDGVYVESSEKWLDFLDKHNISWINWSLTDKDESSALLESNSGIKGVFNDYHLSQSGKFVKEKLRSYS